METMHISGNTHPGKRRKENQDAFFFRQLWTDEKALVAVIDGVGGYAGGEKAAAIAKDCIDQYMQVPSGNTLTMLRESVVFANNRIVEERKKDRNVSEMCCVLTTVVTDTTEGCFWYVHVGDTRLYRFRNGNLQKLTKDHSFVGIREDAGELTEQEAMSHPHRNQILREVGSAIHRLDDEDFIDYGREEYLPGDLLLLCSDGLTDMITSQQITTLLGTDQALTGKVNNLVALANEMGGHDNITVVLVQQEILPVQLQDKVAIPVITEIEKPVISRDAKIKKTQPEKGRVFWLLITLLLVAIAGWYFSPAKKTLASQKVIVTDNYTDDVIPDSNRKDQHSYHLAVPGPVAKPDTMRLTSGKNWTEIKRFKDSTGRMLVLMPQNNSNRFAALRVTSRTAKPGDTLVISDVKLVGFETGIDLHIPVIVKTENLVFENIRYPVSYRFKPDSAHSTVLYMNTLNK